MTATDDERESLIDGMLELDTMLTEGGMRREQCATILDYLASRGFRRQGPITDEWEYRVETSLWGETVFLSLDNARQFVADIEAGEYSEVRVIGEIQRRRAAGPWEPVEAAEHAR